MLKTFSCGFSLKASVDHAAGLHVCCLVDTHSLFPQSSTPDSHPRSRKMAARSFMHMLGYVSVDGG